MRWIIGDIHGMADMLEELVGAVERRDPAARFFFVGDFVNRGPASKRAVDLVLAMPDARCVRGNHDDIFDRILHGTSYAPHKDLPSPLSCFIYFMQYGLDSTLESYGVDPMELEEVARRPNDRAMDRLTAAVPADHRAFFRDLQPLVEEDVFFVAHATWRLKYSDREPPMADVLDRERTARHDIIWNRYTHDQVFVEKPWDRTGFFGHTPVTIYDRTLAGAPKPIVGPKMVLLDTAAALGADGRLTAWCVEESRYIQVDRGHFVLESV